MSETKLHIIAFDVPFPADYGGVIDIFYTIKHLHEQGVSIYLHCFQYGRTAEVALEQYCTQVWYYPRKTGLKGLSLSLPYMVWSRRDDALIHNLCCIDAPILFEGIHTCLLLEHPALKNRTKIIRNHNIEHEYYALLAMRERSLWKRIYFRWEAKSLKKLEAKLSAAQVLLPISSEDTRFFKTQYPQLKVVHIPAFHPFNQVMSANGIGDYCLYQGNLAHPENIEAALFLIEKVFDQLPYTLIIAGRQASTQLITACKGKSNIQLINNPNEEQMKRLIAQAQIHLLPTFQQSGLKLKLLYALFAGRFVITNKMMTYGTGLENECIIAEDAGSFKQKILLWMTAEFSERDIQQRQDALAQYSNKDNAQTIISLVQTDV